MFNKAEYWKNRKAGKRGQGDEPVLSTLAAITPRKPKEPRKRKNRKFTKKGYTHVVKVEEDGSATRVPTKVGSKLHKLAQRNATNYRKQQARSSARESG